MLNAELVLVALALVIGASSLAAAALCAYRLRRPRVERPCTATLLMAITGDAPGFSELIRALDGQTLQPRRLILAIEDVKDPAFRLACAAARGRTGFPIEIVVTGAADRGAQKCHNLALASRLIDAADEAVVLLDADILPTPWWLSALVSPLQSHYCEIVTGYRWPILVRHTFGAHLIAAIDRTIAVLPRLRRCPTAWGGSLALRVDVFAALDLERVLRNTLSDDLTIAASASERGFRLLTRRSLLVPSPSRLGFPAAFQFARRQYQIVHLYRPELWILALLTLSTQLAAWIAIFGRIDTPWAQSAAGAILLLAAAKQLAFQQIGRRLGYPDLRPTWLFQLALALFKPLVDVAHFGMVAAAARTRCVSWSHVRYRVLDPTRISVAKRTPWPDISR